LLALANVWQRNLQAARLAWNNLAQQRRLRELEVPKSGNEEAVCCIGSFGIICLEYSPCAPKYLSIWRESSCLWKYHNDQHHDSIRGVNDESGCREAREWAGQGEYEESDRQRQFGLDHTP
jgi:hypothetical protein